jgi:hypothetical protein
MIPQVPHALQEQLQLYLQQNKDQGDRVPIMAAVMAILQPPPFSKCWSTPYSFSRSSLQHSDLDLAYLLSQRGKLHKMVQDTNQQLYLQNTHVPLQLPYPEQFPVLRVLFRAIVDFHHRDIHKVNGTPCPPQCPLYDTWHDIQPDKFRHMVNLVSTKVTPCMMLLLTAYNINFKKMIDDDGNCTIMQNMFDYLSSLTLDTTKSSEPKLTFTKDIATYRNAITYTDNTATFTFYEEENTIRVHIDGTKGCWL